MTAEVARVRMILARPEAPIELRAETFDAHFALNRIARLEKENVELAAANASKGRQIARLERAVEVSGWLTCALLLALVFVGALALFVRPGGAV